MACTHLAAASSPATTAAALRARATPPAAGFARLPATLHPENGGLALRGRRAVTPVVLAAGPAAAAPVADRDGTPAAVKQPIIVIDNYDSFTYNLCQVYMVSHVPGPFAFRLLLVCLCMPYLCRRRGYMGELGLNFEVYRNDELTIEEVKRMKPRGILISPGPGEPQDSGISLQTVLELGPTIPIFGVCMGLQCIGEAFGGKIIRVPSGVMHGKSSPVYYDEVLGKSIFEGLSNPFTAARYHSLVIEEETFPHDELEVTAWTEDGLVMAARHKKYTHIQGVQFHPESIITPEGKKIILNFARYVEEFEKQTSEGK
uniref:anthranilate synthase n=1 Tax=Triticum urartu TaxID=4572 RepID=A0A8R7PGT7_TRIUA